LGAFVDTVFLRGTQAKGTPAATLLRPLVLTATQADLHAPAALALAILAAALLFRARAVRDLVERTEPLLAPAALAAAALAAVSGLLGPDSRLLGLAGCYLALIGNLAVAVQRLVRRPSRRAIQVGLLAALGFGSAYSLAISWPAFEVMV